MQHRGRERHRLVQSAATRGAVTPGVAPGDWPLGFRPLLRMVAITDTWARLGHPGGADWPRAFLAVAETCAAGHVVEPSRWHQAMAEVAWATDEEAEWGALIIATPVLLMNANPYGHRRTVIQAWGEGLGWSPSTLGNLDQYFHVLGQRNVSSTPELNSALGASPTPVPCPQWADLVALVASLPGQCWPALTLAQRWGWPSVTLTLVGLLSSLQAGAGGLPYAGMAHYGNRLAPCWQGYTADDIDHLADTIHGQWQGGHLVCG
ncbi:MAG: hypothetical protein RLZZ597_2118 [Cyanobacteriota bacterium]|jgi:hypothetical protein